MAFIKTTLTDEITGKNVEHCFNTEQTSFSLAPGFSRGLSTPVSFQPLQRLIVWFELREKR